MPCRLARQHAIEHVNSQAYHFQQLNWRSDTQTSEVVGVGLAWSTLPSSSISSGLSNAHASNGIARKFHLNQLFGGSHPQISESAALHDPKKFSS